MAMMEQHPVTVDADPLDMLIATDVPRQVRIGPGVVPAKAGIQSAKPGLGPARLIPRSGFEAYQSIEPLGETKNPEGS